MKEWIKIEQGDFGDKAGAWFKRVGVIRQDFKDESKQQRNERWEGEWVR